MTWDAIGALGEVIGAAGVIASLLYLAVQVRASTRASAVEAKLRSTRLLSDYMDSLIHDPELNDLLRRGLADLQSLSETESNRFAQLTLKAFWFFSAQHFQFRIGTLSESDWQETRSPLHLFLRSPGFRSWWVERGRASFGPEFREFIEAEMAELDAA